MGLNSFSRYMTMEGCQWQPAKSFLLQLLCRRSLIAGAHGAHTTKCGQDTRLDSTTHNSQLFLIIYNNHLRCCAQPQYYDRKPRKHEKDQSEHHRHGEPEVRRVKERGNTCLGIPEPCHLENRTSEAPRNTENWPGQIKPTRS
jgi:hypothetical protein